MPRVDADGMESFARRVIADVGAVDRAASAVAESLVGADLAGHGSHGVVRLPAYVELVEDGQVDPTATPTRESAGPFDQLVGDDAFGQLTGRRAVDCLLETVEDRGVAIVGVRNSGHLGRIGEWAERVASEGYLFASWVNLQGGAQRIAPSGSADRRLGTNPVTQAVPTFDALPFDLVVDGATSQVAHGKIIERDGSGQRLPAEWTVTDDGTPVERASAFEDGVGALLPLGGSAAGHKGFGLAVVAELFAGVVGDGPVSSEPRQDWIGNGAAFVAVDPTLFTDREGIVDRVEMLAEHVRSAEPIDEDEQVLLPGEPEHRTRRRRGSEGIPVAETVATDLRDLATDRSLLEALPPELR